jgi:hypothetical protein
MPSIMTQSEPFRLTAMSVACLALLYGLMVTFQSKDRPWLDGARMWLPFLLVTMPPYLVILWRLSARPADALGLGLAMACGVLAIVLLASFVIAMARVREMAPLNLFVGLLFWHVTLLTAAFVFVPLQLKLISSAYTALAASGMGRAAGAIGLGMIATVGYSILAAGALRPLGDGTAKAARRSEYSETAATGHLLTLYRCLWREAGPGAVNGFPASEEALRARGSECWNPAIAPGGSAYGTHYDFRYVPGPRDTDGVIRSFAIATKKRNRIGAWTDSFYLDHLGIIRRSVERWATAETDRIESFKRSVIPDVLGLLDAYHDVYGAYPVRMLGKGESAEAGPNDLVITDALLSVRSVEAGPEGTTIIARHDARVVYSPILAAKGGATAFTISVRGGYDGIRDLRSYFINVDGRIHATGEQRDATTADPVAPDLEWAPGARQNTRRRLASTLGAPRDKAS